MSLCVARLRKECKELQRNPVRNIIALPKETNILEWHYVIIGQEDSPYKGGYYHGTVVFPSDYPFKPPTIRMMTPSGRFKPGARLCLSMSDFHPESWNPMWSVGTILLGLYSFMLEDRPTNGSVVSTMEEKRVLALKSLEYNTTNKVYCELFPALVQLYQDLGADSNSAVTTIAGEKDAPSSPHQPPQQQLQSSELLQAVKEQETSPNHLKVAGFEEQEPHQQQQQLSTYCSKVGQTSPLQCNPTDTPTTAEAVLHKPLTIISDTATPPAVPPREGVASPLQCNPADTPTTAEAILHRPLTTISDTATPPAVPPREGVASALPPVIPAATTTTAPTTAL